MSEKQKVIAIDGPSGSGKSTIAKILAENLNLVYLDTGALYRSIALVLDSAGIKEDEVEKIDDYLGTIKMEYSPSKDILVQVNGDDLTQKIREHHVSELASRYSKLPVVRNYLKLMQQNIAAKRAAVLEGRDIGTIIFPQAALKIFLTADPMVRAKRRYEQLIDLGQDVSDTSIDTIAKDIQTRDEQDQTRTVAPLVKASDAVEIDTSLLSIEDVVQKIQELYQARKHLF